VATDVTDLAHTDPCILFALRPEARAFLRLFPPQQRFPGGPCRARFCGPTWLTVLVVETGIGPAAMERALTWLLDSPTLDGVPYRPRVVLGAGFSAGLDPGLRERDLILAQEVMEASGGHLAPEVWPTTWPELPLRGEWRPPLHVGRILTSPTLVGQPEEKQRLGSSQQALALDMESATLARCCTARRIPFGCLRVVLDDVSTPVPAEFATLTRAGRLAPGRLGLAVLKRPTLIRDLWAFHKRSSRAGQQLARGLGEVLTLTLPWMKEEANP
jgi:adenosylhomocysteine nucleosidase